MWKTCSLGLRRVVHLQHPKRIVHPVPHFSINASRTVRTYQTRMTPLDWDSGPLVWIDCEMTGLNTKQDQIIEIAVGFSRMHCIQLI